MELAPRAVEVTRFEITMWDESHPEEPLMGAVLDVSSELTFARLRGISVPRSAAVRTLSRCAVLDQVHSPLRKRTRWRRLPKRHLVNHLRVCFCHSMLALKRYQQSRWESLVQSFSVTVPQSQIHCYMNICPSLLGSRCD